MADGSFGSMFWPLRRGSWHVAPVAVPLLPFLLVLGGMVQLVVRLCRRKQVDSARETHLFHPLESSGWLLQRGCLPNITSNVCEHLSPILACPFASCMDGGGDAWKWHCSTGGVCSDQHQREYVCRAVWNRGTFLHHQYLRHVLCADHGVGYSKESRGAWRCGHGDILEDQGCRHASCTNGKQVDGEAALAAQGGLYLWRSLWHGASHDQRMLGLSYILCSRGALCLAPFSSLAISRLCVLGRWWYNRIALCCGADGVFCGA
mmetsp:Transcript_48513/g.113571  ORF Transcript_48513/g.113571 Transcript_48513/m.113571 type:complete len:262 (+) Transcript_48513:558-1343(+)